MISPRKHSNPQNHHGMQNDAISIKLHPYGQLPLNNENINFRAHAENMYPIYVTYSTMYVTMMPYNSDLHGVGTAVHNAIATVLTGTTHYFANAADSIV